MPGNKFFRFTQICELLRHALSSFDFAQDTCPTVNDPWREPNNLGPVVNITSWDSAPVISLDGFTSENWAIFESIMSLYLSFFLR
jgi:hypothetical protein